MANWVLSASCFSEQFDYLREVISIVRVSITIAALS